MSFYVKKSQLFCYLSFPSDWGPSPLALPLLILPSYHAVPIAQDFILLISCFDYYALCLCASVQFSSVAQSCLTLCNPVNRSTPGLPVHHQLPEFTQTHVHRVGDSIQPSHPLSSPSPPAPNLSQHQGLFT